MAYLILSLLCIAALSFFLGRAKAQRLQVVNGHKNHSLPLYYGQFVGLFSLVPALFLVGLWAFFQPFVLAPKALDFVAPEVIEQSSDDLVLGEIQRLANGLNLVSQQGLLEESEIEKLRVDSGQLKTLFKQVNVGLAGDVHQSVLESAKNYRHSAKSSFNLMTFAALALALVLAAVCYFKIAPRVRARNIFENFVLVILMACSLVAILTTVGIVFSLLGSAYHFFTLHPWQDFFFGLVWNPQFRGGSDLGILPLLWGTIYISIVALCVAVPVGLMIAVYLAEYAGPRTRAITKPAIEILAGIPTIVYGLFALITVGPLLRDFFAEPLGLGTSASSVMTAGLVMGIMLIPFVSSLSDDVINAVPQAMRDGSYGLGATRSETVKRVILPAALPGIVGAILLAASRAIGETMIVVLGAGAAAKLSLNPFEGMATVTAKIVNQLTGDTEFASPETLVAFALGLTLFVFTLAMNVLALYIVRKYREQYE
jgi:phosphate transport system permease protein